MADITVSGSWEAYRDLIELLLAQDCYFLNSMLQKNRDDIFKQPKIDAENDIPPGNLHWYVYSPRWTEMYPGIREVDNIHQGRMFSVDTPSGGPYLSLGGFKHPDGGVKLTFGYRPAYLVNGTTMVDAPESLKKLYRDIKKRHEAMGFRKAQP